MMAKNCVHDSEATTLTLPNYQFKQLSTDYLYHFGWTIDSKMLKEQFGDIKFVCCAGSPNRIEHFARILQHDLNIRLPHGSALINLSCTDRYVMYKVGPVLCVNHGIGNPSMTVVLNEVLKLLTYAECSCDVMFFRMGTCGGIGFDAGTVIVSNGVLNGLLEPVHESIVLGKTVKYPALLDEKLSKDLLETGKRLNLPILQGQTLNADDFYDGEARLDGAFCAFDESSKQAFLKKIYDLGVRNIEMESSSFSALTRLAGLKAAIVCVSFLDRFISDQVTASAHFLDEWEKRPCKIVSRFIKDQLSKINK